MNYQDWTPHFRTPASTLSKVLRSPAFLHSRERSAAIAENPCELRALADSVETLDHTKAPLAVVADQVLAAVRFMRARATRLDAVAALTHSGSDMTEPTPGRTPSVGVVTRERLLIASLHYLVTRVDLVPDFQAGGYVDDVVLLAWVSGLASNELSPYLVDDGEDTTPRET
jgi:hypothetical protein